MTLIPGVEGTPSTSPAGQPVATQETPQPVGQVRMPQVGETVLVCVDIIGAVVIWRPCIITDVQTFAKVESGHWRPTLTPLPSDYDPPQTFISGTVFPEPVDYASALFRGFALRRDQGLPFTQADMSVNRQTPIARISNAAQVTKTPKVGEWRFR